jgi:hypothetical protein
MLVHAGIGFAAAEHGRDGVSLEELCDAQRGVQLRQLRPVVGEHRHPPAAATQLAQRARDVRVDIQNHGGCHRPAELGQQPGERIHPQVPKDHTVVVVVLRCAGRPSHEIIARGDGRLEPVRGNPGRPGQHRRLEVGPWIPPPARRPRQHTTGIEQHRPQALR